MSNNHGHARCFHNRVIVCEGIKATGWPLIADLSGSLGYMCALSENSRRNAAGFHDECCRLGGGDAYRGATDTSARLFLVEGDHRGTCAVARDSTASCESFAMCVKRSAPLRETINENALLCISVYCQ